MELARGSCYVMAEELELGGVGEDLDIDEVVVDCGVGGGPKDGR